MKEIWQTTNTQPWVYALTSGSINAKTRTSKPHVPEGATVLLHTSKSKLWRDWKGLKWTKGLDPKSWDRGKIVAIAEVEEVGYTEDILKKSEYKYWDVYDGRGKDYNSAALFTVRFKNIRPLKNPVETKGFLTPFARAKKEVIKKVIKQNPEVKEILS